MTKDNKDLGRLGQGSDRAGGLRPEPDEQSRPKALIPDAIVPKKGGAGVPEEITLKAAENSQKQVAGSREGNHPYAGGHAFPTHPDLQGHPSLTGMTLRDWFAGQTLAGFIAAPHDTPYGSVIGSHKMIPPLVIANLAYELADAMLAARKGDA